MVEATGQESATGDRGHLVTVPGRALPFVHPQVWFEHRFGARSRGPSLYCDSTQTTVSHPWRARDHYPIVTMGMGRGRSAIQAASIPIITRVQRNLAQLDDGGHSC